TYWDAASRLNLSLGQLPEPAPGAQATQASPTPAMTPTPTAAAGPQFNPDPGQANEPESIEPPSLFPPVIPPLPSPGEEPLPRSLELPRKGVREVTPERHKLPYETYPEAAGGRGLLPGSQTVPNRWFIGFGRWTRYADPSTETPYQEGPL